MHSKLPLDPIPRGPAPYSQVCGALEIERCWFEGFDDAVEVEANNATQMRISQTMIVPDFHRRLLESQPGQWYGWGVKIKFSADNLPPSKGAVRKPNLILDHCTMEGAGLFDLTLSRGPAPISVAVKECAFRLNALLAFNRKRPKTELQIRWEGEANQYEILGRSWIVDSASEGGPAFSKDIDDLDSWLRRHAR